MEVKTGIKPISDSEVNDLFSRKPISISDAASMLRKKIAKNCPPYTAAIIKKNNEFIDEWYETVLLKIANKQGNIDSGRVWPCWIIFSEGKEIKSFKKFEDKFEKIKENEIEYWIKFFRDQPIEELCKVGRNVIDAGWQTLAKAIRFYFGEEKYKLIYSQSDNPYEWDKLANKYPQLLKGNPMPFGLDPESYKDMAQKVNTILSIQVQPDE